ncbi:hypothetical protein F4805DRAFT_457642 [Annulohypoxylon moriforme]|nr:hypothetical protein F4805DRAFT_457642 [Annulohypoxylon moriforme]
MSAIPIREARRRHRSQKRDTELFKKWLEQAAASCGWVKPEKDAKTTTGDIVAQIDLVSRSKNEACLMPDDIYTALCNAISGRETCKDFFSAAKLSSESSKTSHGHFIKILQTAVDKLPRRSSRLLERNSGVSGASSEVEPPPTSQPASIEDPGDEWHLVQNRRRRTQRTTSR